MDKPPTEELQDYLAKGKKAKTKVIFMNGFMVLRIRFLLMVLWYVPRNLKSQNVRQFKLWRGVRLFDNIEAQ